MTAWASAPGRLLERVRPSVVRVHAGRPTGAGGVVWQRNLVLTNHHVVTAGGADLRVVGADGRSRPARVRQASAQLDLALLEVPAGDLVPAPVGQSARLRVGDLVLAVGHPWGQPWVLTLGLVSGLGPVRLPGREAPEEAIRSDVRLAPGNSGGPLLDARGEVVGVNALVIGGDLAVAIPSDVARRWAEAAA